MKKICLIIMVSAILLSFAICGSGAEESLQDAAHNPTYQSQTVLSPPDEPSPLLPLLIDESTPHLECIPDKETEQELNISHTEHSAPEPFVSRRDDVLANAGISEYGWQVAADFLRGFTSIFTGVLWTNDLWDEGGNTSEPVERFFSVWDPVTRQTITVKRVPEVYLVMQAHNRPYAFFDRYGNAITEEPWVYTQRFESYWHGEYHISYSHHYANYFSLFDFDNTGIPDIIIHFQQTFEGCYGGFYRIFRYENGTYRMLEMAAFSDNEQLNWVSFGTTHELYIDTEGRFISFINNHMDGNEYNHLVLGNRAEFHRITAGNDHDWEEWNAHHWEVWDRTPYGHKLASSWRDYNPTIFGTDIAIAPLFPFTDLGAELFMYIYNSRPVV